MVERVRKTMKEKLDSLKVE